MKKVTRKQLMQMDNVLFSKYSEDAFEWPEKVYIKYDSFGNDFTTEPFPITNPDSDWSTCYFDLIENFTTLPLGVDLPISNLETVRDGMFDQDDKVYVVYSKDDVKKMIGKLEQLL